MELQLAPLQSTVVFFINVIGLTLIVALLLSNVKSILKAIFTSMTFFMFIWVDLAFLARSISDVEMSLLFIRIAWSITPMVFVLIFEFIVNFFEKSHKYRWSSLVLFIIAIASFVITLFTDLVILNISFVDSILNIGYGSLVWGFFGTVSILTIIDFYLLFRIRSQNKNDNEAMIKINSLILGLTIFFVANAIFNITFPVFFRRFGLYEFGDYSLIIFLTIIAIVTVRRNFFGVRVLATAFLVIFLGAILLVDTVLFSSSFNQRLVKTIIFISFLPFGFTLIRSIHTAAEQRIELQALNQKLKQLDKKKDEFLNVAAHELRAPMTAIKGYLSMISGGDTGEIGTEATEYLNEAVNENDRLIRLVNNMLNVSRIQEGRMVYELGIIRLSQVSRTIYNEFRAQAEEKGLIFSLAIPDNIEDHVYVDTDRIHEVVANLVSNAIKYTDQGRVVISLSNPTIDIVRIEVSDTGLGLTQDEQSKLFQKFYRAESNIGKTIGTGLGLFITKLLVERFGGRIYVHSQKDKGSTFTIELPINRTPPPVDKAKKSV